MKIRLGATQFGFSVMGILVAMTAWPSHTLAHDDGAQAAAASQHHASTPAKDQTNALDRIVRDATERFQNVAIAEGEGYALQFGFVSGPDAGAMGLHYVNGPLVMDGDLDPTHPEIVIYEALPDGRLKLTGADFLVLKDTWHRKHGAAPPHR